MSETGRHECQCGRICSGREDSLKAQLEKEQAAFKDWKIRAEQPMRNGYELADVKGALLESALKREAELRKAWEEQDDRHLKYEDELTKDRDAWKAMAERLAEALRFSKLIPQVNLNTPDDQLISYFDQVEQLIWTHTDALSAFAAQSPTAAVVEGQPEKPCE